MSIFELDASVKELRELQALIEEANAQIEAIKDKIKLRICATIAAHELLSPSR